VVQLERAEALHAPARKSFQRSHRWRHKSLLSRRHFARRQNFGLCRAAHRRERIESGRKKITLHLNRLGKQSLRCSGAAKHGHRFVSRPLDKFESPNT
jgi:hypothetical protein